MIHVVVDNGDLVRIVLETFWFIVNLLLHATWTSQSCRHIRYMQTHQIQSYVLDINHSPEFPHRGTLAVSRPTEPSTVGVPFSLAQERSRRHARRGRSPNAIQ